MGLTLEGVEENERLRDHSGTKSGAEGKVAVAQAKE